MEPAVLALGAEPVATAIVAGAFLVTLVLFALALLFAECGASEEALAVAEAAAICKATME